MPLQALPASLRVLQASRVPVHVLPQLTSLETLGFEDWFSNPAKPSCDLSILPTTRHCPGLRTLCIYGASCCQPLSCMHHVCTALPAARIARRLPERHPHQLVAVTSLAQPCLAVLMLDDLPADPLPLPYPQLTHLQLCNGEFAMDDVLVMISELPQLEILGVAWISGA